jgi:hypothetical protein
LVQINALIGYEQSGGGMNKCGKRLGGAREKHYLYFINL